VGGCEPGALARGAAVAGGALVEGAGRAEGVPAGLNIGLAVAAGMPCGLAPAQGALVDSCGVKEAGARGFEVPAQGALVVS
jgi:hypothetical protein